jgi:HTH-type transcriptional regulator / antitoxin HipB
MKKKKLKTYSLEEITTKHIGKRGTPKREAFEYELSLEIIGELIKETREEKNFTQAQLGELVGVQKAQISKLENYAGNVTLGTLLKIFRALGTRINFSIESLKEKGKMSRV